MSSGVIFIMFTFTDRQQLLLEWLQNQRSASIGEIEAQFKISPATAYRDARALVQAGMALKTRNGVKLAPPPALADDKCVFCGGPINERLAFVFELQDGSLRKACCPHCGLMGFGKMDVVSAMASDFLYGHMINVRHATFLFESSLNLCCSPSVLCFCSESDAAQFQAGFGGHIHPFEQAVEQIASLMAL
jgi:DeoR family transcriptional regulator, copper-sensing transcriptional repressor